MKYCTTGKRCFVSSAHAKRHAGRMMGERVRAYFCSACKSWHLTHEVGQR